MKHYFVNTVFVLMQCMLYVCFVASLDSKAQTGNATSGEWQEEIYQKVQYDGFLH